MSKTEPAKAYDIKIVAADGNEMSDISAADGAVTLEFGETAVLPDGLPSIIAPPAPEAVEDPSVAEVAIAVIADAIGSSVETTAEVLQSFVANTPTPMVAAEEVSALIDESEETASGVRQEAEGTGIVKETTADGTTNVSKEITTATEKVRSARSSYNVEQNSMAAIDGDIADYKRGLATAENERVSKIEAIRLKRIALKSALSERVEADTAEQDTLLANSD